ncbi:uncharacterized protein METZ01_LOCUS454076, partial [marine metagenome]
QMKHLLLTTIAALLVVGCGHLAPIVARLNSSIHKAARVGHIEVVKKHLAAGVDVNAKDEGGVTPLLVAAAGGHMEIVELLITKGADVNAKAYGGTPLHLAAIRGHKEVAELLIAKGADVNAKVASGAKQGLTPLDAANERNHPETAALLRKHGGKTGEELKAAGNPTEPVAEVAKTESPTQKENHKKICFNQLKQIDGRKEMWAVQERRADGDFPTEAQIGEYFRDGMPSCPDGGAYTIGAVGNQASCSIHGKL